MSYWCAFLTACLVIAGVSGADPGVKQSDQKYQALGQGVLGEDGVHHIPRVATLGVGATGDKLSRHGIRLLAPLGGGEYWLSGPDSMIREANKEGLIHQIRAGNAATKLDWRGRVLSGKNEELAYFVRFHNSVLADRFASSLAEHGVQLIGVSRTVPGAVVKASLETAQMLAEQPEVMAVTLASPRMSPFTNAARHLLDADSLPSLQSGIDLDGSGISVLIYDTSTVNETHAAFGGRLLGLDGSGGGSHATSVAGIIGGNGTGSIGGIYRGFAPNSFMVARIYGSGAFFSTLSDFTDDYEDAIDEYGVVIANNSLGNAACSQAGIGTQYIGAYEAHAEAADAFVRGAGSRSPLVIVWAVGNDRGAGDCEDYNTIMSPATAKNTLSVGSIVANSQISATSSGWGPTRDGRLKPDLVTPGEQSGAIPGMTGGGPDAGGGYSAVTRPSDNDDISYTPGFGGTSAAAPQVAGVSALLYQAYRERFGLDAIMQPALMKAILIHGAKDLSVVGTSYVGPDYHTGYGLVQAAESLELLRSSAWVEGEVIASEMVEYQVAVPSGVASLKVTLAWDDAPGANCLAGTDTCANSALINDLDLEMESPGSSEFFGPWRLDPSSPSTPALSNAGHTTAGSIIRDELNNVEQIVVDTPDPGIYKVRVIGSAVPDGPQRFAIVATPGLRPCSEIARITLDHTHVSLNSQVLITLRDCDLNLNDAALDTIQVIAWSSTDPTGIAVTLIETGVASGEFVGVLNLSSTAQSNKLIVSDTDTVVVEYEDMSPVLETIAAVAVVDGVAPTISLDSIVSVSPTSVWMQFTASEPLILDVVAATQCGEPGRRARSATLGVYDSMIPGFAHDVVLSELTPGDEYFFTVTATDLAGNTATLTGGCIDYVMPREVRFAVEEFKNLGGAAGSAGPRPFDLSYTSIELRPVQAPVAERGSEVTIYTARKTGIDRLPVDPTGGEQIFPFDPTEDHDDAYEYVSFADSKLFTLYDLEDSESFGGVYIGSNGYVTFGDGDTSHTATLSGFYAFARISALWTNLDPERGGTVSHKQHDDRFVITWQNVPRYLSFDSNTFQIELRFDGVIVLSWLEGGISDTIVGVAPSDGSGGGLGAVPSSFIPTDFTNAGTSGPTPPSPVSHIVRTATGAPILIKLEADDDGEPYGFLRYKIVSLPAVGTLKDADTGFTITTVAPPYVLASFGDGVIFVPPSSTWDGQTSFEFVADDTWPDLPCPEPPCDPLFPSQSSDADPIPNDGQSVPGRILIQAGEQRLVRSFLVDDTLNTSGWTGFSSGQWEFGQPTGGSSQPNSNDPTSGFTGDNVIGYNLAGDYENSLSAQRLVTPAIDCTDFTGVRLRFMRWLCVEGAPDDNAVLEVSNDGVNWGTKPLWSNPTTGTLLDRGWRRVEYDISDVADGEATVYVRWTMGSTDVSGRFAGWNIDDIIVDGFIEVECPADVNGDDSVNSSDVFALLSNQGLVDEPSPYDVNGDGIVDGEDLAIVLANIGMTCP